MAQQNSKTLFFKISKSAHFFQHPERKWDSYQLAVHKPLWIQERGFNHLFPPRARRTGSTPRTKGSALWLPPSGPPITYWKILRGFIPVTRAHFGEVGRVTSEPVASQKGAGNQSQHLLNNSPVSNREFWREFEEDFSASHLSIGGPVGPSRQGGRGPSSTICMFTLVCTPIISKQRQRKALGCS